MVQPICKMPQHLTCKFNTIEQNHHIPGCIHIAYVIVVAITKDCKKGWNRVHISPCLHEPFLVVHITSKKRGEGNVGGVLKVVHGVL
jgi:hypothetical protein